MCSSPCWSAGREKVWIRSEPPLHGYIAFRAVRREGGIEVTGGGGDRGDRGGGGGGGSLTCCLEQQLAGGGRGGSMLRHFLHAPSLPLLHATKAAIFPWMMEVAMHAGSLQCAAHRAVQVVSLLRVIAGRCDYCMQPSANST